METHDERKAARMIRSYPRGKAVPLSPHFLSKEFDCHCGCCKQTTIDDELVSKLEAFRVLIGVPLTINSGYRCCDYQADLRRRGYETAVGTSEHEKGRAVDLATGMHSGKELEIVARKAGFRAVGVSGNWIHVDLRADRDRRWVYAKR